jgi:hypothetical protein
VAGGGCFCTKASAPRPQKRFETSEILTWILHIGEAQNFVASWMGA